MTSVTIQFKFISRTSRTSDKVRDNEVLVKEFGAKLHSLCFLRSIRNTVLRSTVSLI